MADLERLRFLSANYESLQGLKYVPLGLMLILMTLWGNSLGKPTTDNLTPLTLIIIGCMVMLLAVDRYYARVFGRVQRTTANKLLDWIVGIGGYLLAVVAFNFDARQILPVSTMGLVYAGFFLATYVRITRLAHGHLLLWYPVMAVLMIGLSLAPLFAPADWWRGIGIHSPVLTTWFIFGLMLILTGVLTHLFLVRSLAPAAEVENG